MKRFFLIAAITLLALTSCKKDDASPDKRLLDTWVAVELTLALPDEEPEVSDLLDVANNHGTKGTLRLDEDYNAVVNLINLSTETEEDSVVYSKEFTFTTDGNQIAIGPYNLTYTLTDDELIIYGQGLFFVNMLLELEGSTEQATEEDAAGLTSKFIFKRDKDVIINYTGSQMQ